MSIPCLNGQKHILPENFVNIIDTKETKITLTLLAIKDLKTIWTKMYFQWKNLKTYNYSYFSQFFSEILYVFC